MIRLDKVSKTYVMGDVEVKALNNISLEIASGDYVAIMGPSGSGKSTLMHVLGLLDPPQKGFYQINGQEAAHLKPDELATLRQKEIGFIFQQFHLLPRLSALQNVLLPQMYSAFTDVKLGKSLLDRMGIGSRLDHRPNEMSGGQQQRVAIARSLINTPNIIMADEPTGNLDSASEKEVIEILEELNAKGMTIIVVTHEEEIGRKASRLIRMRDGQVQSDERIRPLKMAPKSVATIKETRHVRADQFLKYLKQGIQTLLGNKIRTALSALGIMIGVAAVVTMLALGKGAQLAIADQLSTLGTNLLVLKTGAMPVAGGYKTKADSGLTTRLTNEDAQAIEEQIPSVNEAAPNVAGRAQVVYLNQNWSTSIMGVTPLYARIHSMEPELGRFFSSDENRSRARVAIIGATIVHQLFGDKSPLGELIKISKINFRIIGVLPEKGASNFHDEDDVIFIPLNTAMHRLLGRSYVDAVELELNDPGQADDVQDKTLDILFSRHRVPMGLRQDAFQIRNMGTLQAAMAASTNVMTLLLFVIAAVSLLVGGIGIMNIMLVSVTERTREIGLRKAVGARSKDILLQFLAESLVVSLLGGICGILLAWLATWLLSHLAGWSSTITPGSIFLAFSFSVGMGIVFGLYPARKASLLAPIDALRYE